MIIKIDKYELSFNNVDYKMFEDNQCYGVTFILGEERYEVLHNKTLGNRLLINKANFWNKDIPFKKETFGFLPDCITCKEI